MVPTSLTPDWFGWNQHWRTGPGWEALRYTQRIHAFSYVSYVWCVSPHSAVFDRRRLILRLIRKRT